VPRSQNLELLLVLLLFHLLDNALSGLVMVLMVSHLVVVRWHIDRTLRYDFLGVNGESSILGRLFIFQLVEVGVHLLLVVHLTHPLRYFFLLHQALI
jgi:hypothetical protein